jgi:Pyruvate/2-oxoacid:ferredoxin oxidoreductase delta subunit
MSGEQVPIHYVVTHEKALAMIREHHRFWVSNCGCRERHGKCERSRMDVCLMFGEDTEGTGSGKKEIRLAEVVEILFKEAKAKHLVARPFRNESRTETEGICFCCDDCCAYFLDPTEKCDKGEMIEKTGFDACDQCAICIDVCYFGARKINGGKLEVEREKCYGCGLCADVCPVKCVEMVER